MRFRAMLILPVCLLTLAACAERVDKPKLESRGGTGPLAIKMKRGTAAPEYHFPREYWRTHHMDLIAKGDFEKRECVICHDTEASCNKCHLYVGVPKVCTIMD